MHHSLHGASSRCCALIGPVPCFTTRRSTAPAQGALQTKGTIRNLQRAVTYRLFQHEGGSNSQDLAIRGAAALPQGLGPLARHRHPQLVVETP